MSDSTTQLLSFTVGLLSGAIIAWVYAGIVWKHALSEMFDNPMGHAAMRGNQNQPSYLGWDPDQWDDWRNR